MDTVDLAYAKEHLEDLAARAASGQVVYFHDSKLGTFKVVPVVPGVKTRPKRSIGQWKDTFIVPERLFEPLTDDELSWLSGEEAS